MRMAQLSLGMRVLTPSGQIARVEDLRENKGHDDLFDRVDLVYLDRSRGQVSLQAKDLQLLLGPLTVRFHDEEPLVWVQHGDTPLILPVED